MKTRQKERNIRKNRPSREAQIANTNKNYPLLAEDISSLMSTQGRPAAINMSQTNPVHILPPFL
jgi:hypothetical protein